jgi:hypothetical protein
MHCVVFQIQSRKLAAASGGSGDSNTSSAPHLRASTDPAQAAPPERRRFTQAIAAPASVDAKKVVEAGLGEAKANAVPDGSVRKPSFLKRKSQRVDAQVWSRTDHAHTRHAHSLS